MIQTTLKPMTTTEIDAVCRQAATADTPIDIALALDQNGDVVGLVGTQREAVELVEQLEEVA